MAVDTDHGISRSISGWLVMHAGAAVTWAVRAQMLPSLSSTEAELYGLSTAVCDLLTSVQVMEEMLLVFGAPITIMTDSRGARLLTEDVARGDSADSSVRLSKGSHATPSQGGRYLGGDAGFGQHSGRSS